MNIPLLLNSYKNKSFLENNDLKSKVKRYAFLLLFMLSNLYLVNAQVSDLPYSTDFTSGTAGWYDTRNPDSNYVGNKWWLKARSGASAELYVSTHVNGDTNDYSSSPSIVHVYRDFAIPAAVMQINIKYKYRAVGNSKDYFRVWLVPQSYIPEYGKAITTATDRILFASGQKTQVGVWENNFEKSTDASRFSNGTMRLVFEWINSSSTPSQTAVAIDDLKISAFNTCKPTSNGKNTAYIKNVKFFQTLISDTDNLDTGISPNGYRDYSNLGLRAKQIPGGVINVAVDPSSDKNEMVAMKAWVDWNRDGVYEHNTLPITALSEKVYDPTVQGVNVMNVVFGFKVPLETAPGIYKIRIRISKSDDANFTSCSNSSYRGETEDYIFEVVADSVSQIITAPTARKCGAGPVMLSATASAGSSFRWYKKEFGTPVIEETPTGSFTTKESLAVGQHVYFVTAVKDSIESVYKTPVRIVVNPVPVITLVPPANPEICGLESSVTINSSGNKQEKEIFKEDFEGVVKFARTPDPTTEEKKATHWFVRNADYILNPELYIAVRPALSSGFNGGNFSNIVTATNGRNYDILNYYTTTVPIVTTNITDVKLDFDIYYFSEEDVFAKNRVRVQYSIDNGTSWVTLRSTAENANSNINLDATYIKDIGTPGRFYRETMILPAECENKPNLKIRYSVFALGNSNEFIADVVAIDNVRVYGNIDTPPLFSWTINGVSAGSATDKFIIKPTAEEIQNNTSFEIIAYAETANGCTIPSTPFTLVNNSKTWMSTTSTNWSDIKWKPGASLTDFSMAPTKDQCVIIKEPIIVGTGSKGLAKNITIQQAGSLNIKSGASLTVTDFFKNEYKDGSGNESGANVVIESDANLIQVNDAAVNTGKATVKRDSQMKRLDYIYWGTPVEGQPLNLFSPLTVSSRFYSYNEIDDSFSIINPLTNPMVKGKGYVIRAPNTFNPLNKQKFEGIFVGKATNGVVEVDVVKSATGAGKNLVGNPYPSNIDLDLLTANNPLTAQGTYLFWTNFPDFNKDVVTDYGAYGTYGSNHYATYNGVGTAAPANIDIIPTNIIKPGQGFLYVAKTSGKLSFKNTLRTTESTGSIFISNKNGKTIEGPRSEKYRLKLTTPIGNFNTLLLAYFEGATNSFESIYDSEFPVASSDQFYSISDGANLIIQGRQYPFIEDDIVQLGMAYFIAGEYIISLSEKEGIFNNGQNIYLKDKQAGIVTNLSLGDYSFTANEGVSNSRFEIIYKPEIVLGTDSNVKEGIIVYRDSDVFVIKSPKTIKKVEVYDLSGRLIASLKPDSKEGVLEASKITKGIYVLKITATDGEISNKKISK